jgi:hypothetical protein
MILHNELACEVLDYFPLEKLYVLVAKSDDLMQRYGPVLGLPSFENKKPIFHLQHIDFVKLSAYDQNRPFIQEAYQSIRARTPRKQTKNPPYFDDLVSVNKDHIQSVCLGRTRNPCYWFPTSEHIRFMMDGSRINNIHDHTPIENVVVHSFNEKLKTRKVAEEATIDPRVKNSKDSVLDVYTKKATEREHSQTTIIETSFFHMPVDKQNALLLYGADHEPKITDATSKQIATAVVSEELDIHLLLKHNWILECCIKQLDDQSWESVHRKIQTHINWFPKNFTYYPQTLGERTQELYRNGTDVVKKRMFDLAINVKELMFIDCLFEIESFSTKFLSEHYELLPKPLEILKRCNIKYSYYSDIKFLSVYIASVKKYGWSFIWHGSSLTELAFNKRYLMRILNELKETLCDLSWRGWNAILDQCDAYNRKELFLIGIHHTNFIKALEYKLLSEDSDVSNTGKSLTVKFLKQIISKEKETVGLDPVLKERLNKIIESVQDEQQSTKIQDRHTRFLVSNQKHIK